QQLVADLLLQPPLLALARLFLGARAVLLEPHLERIVDRRGRQQPRLTAQAQKVRAGDPARKGRLRVAYRLLPPRASLGVSPAGVKRGETEALGKLLLGPGPFAAQLVKAHAAEHGVVGSSF